VPSVGPAPSPSLSVAGEAGDESRLEECCMSRKRDLRGDTKPLPPSRRRVLGHPGASFSGDALLRVRKHPFAGRSCQE
jgi:hypothetical protein